MEAALTPSPYICEPSLPPAPDNYLARIARNHARILNHLDLIRRKVDLGARLGLAARSPEENGVCGANMETLDALQRETISLSEAVASLAERAGFGVGARARAAYVETTQPLTEAGHIELHPTDICDHRCLGCYYADRGTATMPLEHFEQIPAQVRPRSIVLVGGGEPTLYRRGDATLGEAIARIRAADPNIRLGMVTKGTHIPPGEWQRELEWIRVSVDSATPETFELMKGRDAFELVLQNFFSYLEGPIPHVGTGYLFCRLNIHETAPFARLLFERIREQAPQLLEKADIQFRPLRPAPDFPEKQRKGHTDLTWLCEPEQVHAAVGAFERACAEDAKLARFLLRRTNWQKVGEGNDVRASRPFDRCYYALAFRLYRPDGDVYPCFVRVSDPAYRLGRNFGLSEEEALRINLLTFLVFNRKRPYCFPERCRMCWVNHPAAEGFQGRLAPPTGEAAKSSFF